MKLAKYLLASMNIVNKDGVGENGRKSIRKSRNKIVEILAKSKN